MEREQTILSQAITDAGRRVLTLAESEIHTQTKADHSPVTSVDLAVNRDLEAALLGAFPDDGWLSEESPDSPARLSKPRVWIIDPIDGTRALLKRRPTFVISVALAQEGEPILAAIYNPSTNELFTAMKGAGARLNGQAIRASAPRTSPLDLLVNQTELERGRFRALGSAVRCQSLGSIAYSLALVAAGQAPAMMTFDRENEWDVAAATLLIREAGGVITDASGRPFQFNQPNPSLEGTVASSAETLELVTGFLQRLRAAA